jgi:hypothetical protein
MCAGCAGRPSSASKDKSGARDQKVVVRGLTVTPSCPSAARLSQAARTAWTHRDKPREQATRGAAPGRIRRGEQAGEEVVGVGAALTGDAGHDEGGAARGSGQRCGHAARRVRARRAAARRRLHGYEGTGGPLGGGSRCCVGNDHDAAWAIAESSRALAGTAGHCAGGSGCEARCGCKLGASWVPHDLSNFRCHAGWEQQSPRTEARPDLHAPSATDNSHPNALTPECTHTEQDGAEATWQQPQCFGECPHATAPTHTRRTNGHATEHGCRAAVQCAPGAEQRVSALQGAAAQVRCCGFTRGGPSAAIRVHPHASSHQSRG